MIVFDLACNDGHRFEGWFGSTVEFDRQREAGLIGCPQCGSADVAKAVMAPALARKGNQVPARRPERTRAPAAGETIPVSRGPLPPQALAMMRQLAAVQAKVLESSRWVGDRFAEDARAMHYHERDAEPIHGQATLAEARSLIEEGIEIAPLPFPIVPPGKAN